MLELFGKMKVEDAEVRDWFRLVLASQTRDAQQDSRAQREELARQASLLVAQQDRLLNLRRGEEVDQDTFGRKHTELRDRLASVKLQLDALDRSHDETAELAAKVFELALVAFAGATSFSAERLSKRFSARASCSPWKVLLTPLLARSRGWDRMLATVSAGPD